METLDLTLGQLNHRLLEAADAVDAALVEYRICNSQWVEAEMAHREARARVRPELTGKLAADREDELFLRTKHEWFNAEMKKALRDTAKEALRATMAILNGLQSVASAHRDEARLASWNEGRSA